MAVLDQLRAESAHRAILFHAVAVRHDDRGRESMPPRRESHRLAVIAAARRDDAAQPRLSFTQPRDIRERTTDLEGPRAAYGSRASPRVRSPSAHSAAARNTAAVGGTIALIAGGEFLDFGAGG
jgi:hypothetical protein